MRRFTVMYAPNCQQAVKMRGLAAQLRCRVRETGDEYYRRLFQNAALDLESAAEALERSERDLRPQ
jgi:hypothetical protein